MADNDKVYKIAMRHQWWIDSGIAGLYNIAMQTGLASDYDVEMVIENNGLTFRYMEGSSLQQFLVSCYEELALRYWNVSTKKQREEPKAVFWNQDENDFYLKAKRNPTPLPSLFTKGSSWRLVNENSGIMFAHVEPSLRKRLDIFLRENKVQLWGNKKILLLEDPVCHKTFHPFPQETNRKTVCSICGKESSNCTDVSQPAYLLFASNTATKSFNSEAGGPNKICWECEMLGKFAVEAANYRKNYDDLFILQVVSSDLKKIINVNHKIGYASYMRELDEDNFLCNIRRSEKSTIAYSKSSYEFLWSFYIQAYTLVKKEWENKQIQKEFLLDEFLDLSLSIAPVQIILMAITSKGQTFITKELILYNDTTYIFRFPYILDQNNINFNTIFNSLYVKDEKTRFSNFRNRFFYLVLNGKSVLIETENFAFHMSMGNQAFFLKEILNFIRIYEPEIGGIKMNNEQVEIATNLGKAIVIQASEMMEKSELKKIKGDLFTLRKTRTKAEFLSQINTLQMRYGLIVSKQFSAGVLEEVQFEEFKAYCVLGALNTYNSFTKTKKNEGSN